MRKGGTDRQRKGRSRTGAMSPWDPTGLLSFLDLCMLSSLGCSDLLLNTSSILQPLTISTSERLGTNLRALAEISETQEGTKSGVSPPSSLSQTAPSRISAVRHSQRASPFIPWSSLPGGHCRGPWGLQGVLLTLLASVALASAALAGLYAVSYLYLLTFLC